MRYTFLITFLLVSLSTSGQTVPDSIKFPTPTGSFTVGVTSFYWSDSTRHEKATPDSTDFRQFAASVFYPGLRDHEPPRAYFPDLDLFRASFQATSIPGPRGVVSFSRHFPKIATQVYERIPVDKSGEPYPVVLISPGGDMSRHWYTAMAQEFASHGYVVVVASHAHSGIDIFPLGGVIRKNHHYKEDVPRLNAMITQRMTEDIIFVTDRILELNSLNSDHFLMHSMDTGRIAIVGHSRGARAVNCVLKSDGRFTGGIRLDETGPDLVLSRPHMTIRAPWKNEAQLKELRHLHTSSRATSYEVVIDNVSHFSFSDLTLVAPDTFGAEITPLAGHVQINEIMMEFLSAIFDQDGQSSVLEGGSPMPENVTISVYQPGN